jgi:hypothetical protein
MALLVQFLMFGGGGGEGYPNAYSLTVNARLAQADKETDEIYAQMTLQPVHSVSERWTLHWCIACKFQSLASKM